MTEVDYSHLRSLTARRLLVPFQLFGASRTRAGASSVSTVENLRGSPRLVGTALAALEKDGFSLARQTGSHRHSKHSDGRRVTISFHHSSDTFRPKTLRSMIEIQAQWKYDDLVRLELV